MENPLAGVLFACALIAVSASTGCDEAPPPPTPPVDDDGSLELAPINEEPSIALPRKLRQAPRHHEAVWFIEGVHLFDQVERSLQRQTEEQLREQLEIRDEEPSRVLALLDLEPGMRVADIGCGAGFYAVQLGQRVGPAGKVYALDIQQAAVEHLRTQLEENPDRDPHGVIHPILSRIDDTTLDPDSLDAAVMSHADFHTSAILLDDNRAMLESCRRSLAPGGRMVVVQLLGPSMDEMSANVVANFQAAGFTTVSTETDRERRVGYFLFEAPGAEPPPRP